MMMIMKSRGRTSQRKKAPASPGSRFPRRRRLEHLIDEATVDAYNESEQRGGIFTMIEESLTLPFETTVLGVAVVVERIDLTDSDEIVAVCRRGKLRQTIPLLDLPLPDPPPTGSEWIEAYRYWARGAS
jgi:hypothetical protein